MFSMAILKIFFIPLFTYDEKGFINPWLGARQEGAWDNVKKVDRGFRFPGVTVTTKDGQTLMFAYFLTKDSSKALSEIVHYVRKNSPNAPIHPSVLERLKKIEK